MQKIAEKMGLELYKLKIEAKMATRFMVKNKKGFYLQREASNNSGCTGWAVGKELGLVFDYMREAKQAITHLPGSSALYTIELSTGVAGPDRLCNFNFKWQHKEGLRTERMIENLTEMEMIDRIFEEAKKDGLPIINAEVRIVEGTTKKDKVQTVEMANNMKKVEKSM